MRGPTWRSLEDGLRSALGPDLDLTALADVVYAEVARRVPYSFACLATTDPASGVVTWTSKTRSLGVGDEEFAAAEYGPADINKFEDIARRAPPVGALSVDTGGRPEDCRRHREYMHPRFGFTDELRAVFVSRAASWGALGLYRGEGEPPFTAEDAAVIGGACETVAAAIQRALFRLGPPGRGSGAVPHEDTEGPAVLIVDSADRVTHITPAARFAIDDLGGWDHGSLPANVLAVVATARSTGEHFVTRALATPGRWMSLRAAPLDATEGVHVDVVVSIEPTPRATLSRLALAARGLTAREEEVALLVLQGLSTQSISAALHLSPHTVQDHLKAIFAKVGVSSRRELTATLVLT
jgi:DNA-binding CsgD family transcriptional regulator